MKGAEAQTAGDAADQETAFWRGFIEWWVREREGPVPARAWEALAWADTRRRAGNAGTGATLEPTDHAADRGLN